MSDANTAQAEFWASGAGAQWIVREALLDALLSPVLTRVLHHVALMPGEAVLDIGCGTGASCMAAASAVGATGHITGVDIAAQLLDRARSRAAEAGFANTSFVLADAQTHAFAPASVDAMISRFGVMFFEDPVAAFANMAKALKPGGRLVFAAWAPAAQVPWFSIPYAAAVAQLGKPTPADPNAPGPLAFQDVARVTDMMAEAGLQNPRAVCETVQLTPEGPFADIVAFAAQVGPAARIIAEFSATEADAAAIVAAVSRGFAKYQTDQGLRVPAGIHLYCASAATT